MIENAFVWRYAAVQFLGYIFQIFPVVLLLFAPFPENAFRWSKNKLVSAFSVCLLAVIGITVGKLSADYMRGESYEHLLVWGNMVFAAIWVVGTAVYFLSLKGDNRRGSLVCYFTAMQYGVFIYTLSEIAVKFIHLESYETMPPYTVAADIVYGGAFLLAFPLIYHFVRKYSFPGIRRLSSKSRIFISVCLVMLFLLYVAALTLEMSIPVDRRYVLSNIYLSLWLICMLLSNGFVYAIYFFVLHVESEKEMMDIQIATYDIQCQSMMAKIQEEKKMHHNMRHHFRTLISLTENGEYDAVKAYLQKYLKEWEELRAGQISDNPQFNTILGYYVSQAEQKQIKVITDIEMKAYYPLDMMDMTVLLGNAMENALEACERAGASEPFISISIRQKKQMLLIKIENSCEDSSLAEDETRHLPKSSKKGRISGYGISSMQNIARRYQGELDFFKDGTTFILRIVLNIPDNER